VGWILTPRPGCFNPWNEPVPIVYESGYAQGCYGRMQKISPPPGFDPQTAQPVASRYTDDIPAHRFRIKGFMTHDFFYENVKTTLQLKLIVYEPY